MRPTFTLSANTAFRGGFTQLELLLVLAVMLAVAGLVVTGAQQFSSQHRLEQAAAEVELLLAQARLDAVESGSAVLFCYQPGGRGYGLVPLLPPEEGAAAAGTQAATLPQGLSFQAFQQQEQSSFQLSNWHQQQLAAAAEDASAPWSVLALFLPDGTCQDATLEVADQQGQMIRLHLRGLTGTVTQESLQMQAAR